VFSQQMRKARRVAACSIPGNLASANRPRHRAPMRRLIFASALILAGCATRPEPTPVPQEPTQAVPVQPQITQLPGRTTRDLTGHSGRPALQVQEGPSLKLQFRGRYCVLDAYLYPGQNGVLRVTHVDTRNTSGSDVDQATCISALEYPSWSSAHCAASAVTGSGSSMGFLID